MHPYGDKVTIETEKILGEEPPRADYLVLVKDKDVSLEKEIFKIFRKLPRLFLSVWLRLEACNGAETALPCAHPLEHVRHVAAEAADQSHAGDFHFHDDITLLQFKKRFSGQFIERFSKAFIGLLAICRFQCKFS